MRVPGVRLPFSILRDPLSAYRYVLTLSLLLKRATSGLDPPASLSSVGYLMIEGRDPPSASSATLLLPETLPALLETQKLADAFCCGPDALMVIVCLMNRWQ